MYRALIYMGIVWTYSASSEDIPNNTNSSLQAVTLSVPTNISIIKDHGFGVRVGMARMDPKFKSIDEDGSWYPEDFPNLSATLLVQMVVDGSVRKNWSIGINASHLETKPWFLNDASPPINHTLDRCFEHSLEKNSEISIQAYFSKPSFDLVEDFMPLRVEISSSEDCSEYVATTSISIMHIFLIALIPCLILVIGIIFLLKKKLENKQGERTKNGSTILKKEYKKISDVEAPTAETNLNSLTVKIPCNDQNLAENTSSLKFEEKETSPKESLTTPTEIEEKIKEVMIDDLAENTPTQKVKEKEKETTPEGSLPTSTEIEEKAKEVNILLLGQTGVGKSTFINGFANYLQFPTLDEAEAHEGLISPVASQFTITDENTFAMKTIVTGIEENESQAAAQGQSATQNAKAHVFPFGDLQVRLIDTPGIGDTRGVEQDKENFKQILSYISNYDEIHGICILLKPNESRLDIMFRFCIQELLMHLHKSATANMVFCFTNARNTNYRPGDTMQPLKELLNKNGLSEDIKIRKEIIYCVDNEAFRYLAAIKNGISFDTQDQALFSTSWLRSRATSEGMVNFFISKTPHKVKNTLSMNDTRRMITEITKPLAEMTKHIQIQIDDVNDQKEEIMRHTGNINQLRKRLTIRITDLVRDELEQPRTVCTSAKCTKKIGFENNKRTNYMKHCHPECTLSEVVTDVVDNADLRKCLAMDSETGNCNECGCVWNKHMHVTYQMKEVEKEGIDIAVKDQLQSKHSIIETKQELIQNAEKKIKEMIVEKDTILKISAKFGCFLKENAMTPYNDAMIAYINHQIREEQDKIGRQIGNQERVIKLEQSREMYEEEIMIIEASIKMEKTTKLTLEEIKKLKEDLFNLPNFGANIKKIYMDIEKERMTKTNKNSTYYKK